jgi:signal transduction histidine kinase
MGAAVEAFGRDIRHPPLDVTGPSEVRQAAQAFNAMQERVRGYMAERTQILAAVTHDLKTPLTRMRLRLEACGDDALRDKLGGDLSAMQSLIEEGLELARSLDATEASARIDLDALLSSIADDAADAGQPVRYSADAGAAARLVAARPNGLRRAIENLVDNALKYGHEAEISLAVADAHAVIRILDRGPGIPEEHLSEVMQPFVRLEGSRSRESGGTGLGLAIASNLLAAQGATLTLANRAEGGLEARIVLSLSGG